MDIGLLHKLLLSELEKLSIKLDKTEKDVQSIDKELFKVNQHLSTYNNQLEIHIKRSELSEQRLEIAEEQVSQMLNSVEIIKDMIVKFDHMYNDFKEEQSKKSFLEDLELKRKQKINNVFEKSRIIVTILGIPLAVFGLFEGIQMLISIFGGK